MSGSILGRTAARSSLRQGVLLVGWYAAVLCWASALWMLASIPGLAHAPGWFLAPPTALTLALCAVWLQGRERPARREPRHKHVHRRHVLHPVLPPAPALPRSPLSRSLLVVSVYTAALTWGGLILMAWNGAAWVVGSVFLIVPLLATLLAIFASAYRGRVQA